MSGCIDPWLNIFNHIHVRSFTKLPKDTVFLTSFCWNLKNSKSTSEIRPQNVQTCSSFFLLNLRLVSAQQVMWLAANLQIPIFLWAGAKNLSPLKIQPHPKSNPLFFFIYRSLKIRVQLYNPNINRRFDSPKNPRNFKIRNIIWTVPSKPPMTWAYQMTCGGDHLV